MAKSILTPKAKKALGIIGKIFNYAILAFLIVLLAFNVYAMVSRLVFKNDLPKLFGTATAIVVSGSMGDYPAINDMVIIKEQDDYYVGDIITFRQDGLIVTHRIITVTENGFITQGDANNAPDKEIPFSAVEGKVVAVLKGVGAVISFFRTTYGLLVLLVVGALVIYAPTIAEKIKTFYRKKKDGSDAPIEDTEHKE